MRVYHASPCIVDHPDIKHSRDCLDFGRGFYVTSLQAQAEAYGQRFILRKKKAYLNSYELDEDALSSCKVLRFVSYDEAWLDYVMACRSGDAGGTWDAVIGGVANDRVFRTVDLYFSGDISKTEALDRLIYEKPNIQICLRTQEAIERCLSFLEVTVL